MNRSPLHKPVHKQVKVLIPILLAALILTFSASCTTDYCFEETNAYLKASFYLESTGKVHAPDSLSLYGSGHDSLIYKKEPDVTMAFLPLNASADSCRFIFKINGISDTVTFIYSSYPHLISKVCGYTFYHKIETPRYTGNIIDTITIRQNTITTDNEENILIYY